MAEDDTIAHFSHPGHELVKRHYVGPAFICDMCWEDLSGPAYGCRAGCDFAISLAHHPHQLELTQTARDVAFACDVCAPGCFLYGCPPCGFDMHPRCTKLPTSVRSARHPAHDLTLAVAEARCAACGHGGHAWFYRCSACRLDLHASCAAAAGGRSACHDENGGVGLDDVHGGLVRARISAESQMRVATALATTNASFRSAANLIGCELHVFSLKCRPYY